MTAARNSHAGRSCRDVVHAAAALYGAAQLALTPSLGPWWETQRVLSQPGIAEHHSQRSTLCHPPPGLCATHPQSAGTCPSASVRCESVQARVQTLCKGRRCSCSTKQTTNSVHAQQLRQLAWSCASPHALTTHRLSQQHGTQLPSHSLSQVIHVRLNLPGCHPVANSGWSRIGKQVSAAARVNRRGVAEPRWQMYRLL